VRLFVAAEIGERLAGRAEELIHELEKRTADAAPRARLTWLAANRLHITIRFIGEVDDVRAAAIVAALQSPIDVQPFDLTLAGTGTFPEHGPPRVVWTGIEQGRDGLIALEREVRSRLTTFARPPEGRPYSPHLTLARVREAAGLRSASLLEGLEDRSIGTTRIDTITLFESRLSPKGSIYVPLLRTSLRAG